MRRFGRPVVLAGFAALFAIGVTLVFVGGRPSARERFIDDAAEVCAASKARIQAATDAILGADPSRQEIESFLAGAFTDELRNRVERLRALDVPGDDVERFGALVEAYADVVETIDANPTAAAAGADPFAAVDARFDDYGLPECGSAPVG